MTPDTEDTAQQPVKPPEGVLGWFSWALLAVGIVAMVAYGVTWRPPVADIELTGNESAPRQLPPFELTSQEGKKVSLDSLRGKVWVGTFMFTGCTNACPQMAAELLRIQKTIRNDKALEGKLRLVSFSLDPDNDTQGRLDEYSTRQGIDSSCWSFLRGERQEIIRLCEEGFGLSAGGLGNAGGVTHSDRFVLVDPGGRTRGSYRPGAVADDLGKLLEEARALIKEAGL